jgi:tRNA-dihydrouridine synthase A
MRKSRFTEEQIIAILTEQERGMATGEVCRKHGISPASFFKWKAKFGGMDVSDARKLKTLQLKRDAAQRAIEKHSISQRRACRLVSVDPKTVRREREPDCPGIRQRMRANFSTCLRFAPTDERSAKCDPLPEARRGLKEVRDVQNVADIFVDPEGPLDRPNYWEKTAHALLVGVVLHVLYLEENNTLAGCALLYAFVCAARAQPRQIRYKGVQFSAFVCTRSCFSPLKVQKKMVVIQSYRFCVAPMMDWTDRWCRLFHRGLTRHALLFTEMVVDHAITRGPAAHLIKHDAEAGPVALQLGGHHPVSLAEAARIGEAEGYAEINLNCGCPSDRVQDGRIGACLMREAHTVADAVFAMQAAVQVPVTVKCRLGVDDQNVEETLPHFLAAMRAAGVGRVYLHARKAWLNGLSPKENRNAPPLNYALVHEMKCAFPDIELVLNGGLPSPEIAHSAMEGLDGVMLGRAAYHDPFSLTRVDGLFFGDHSRMITRADAVEHLIAIVKKVRGDGQHVHRVTRHALGLFNGVQGARAWRQGLTRIGQDRESGSQDVASLASGILEAARSG